MKRHRFEVEYEHRKAVLMSDHYSKIVSHIHECHHQIDFDNVKVVGHEPHYHQRLFLEAWMSVKDPNAGNEHIVISEVLNHAKEPFSIVTCIYLMERLFVILNHA